ncbi:MAG: ATP-binding protein [Nanoarchaeota archaeon]
MSRTGLVFQDRECDITLIRDALPDYSLDDTLAYARFFEKEFAQQGGEIADYVAHGLSDDIKGLASQKELSTEEEVLGFLEIAIGEMLLNMVHHARPEDAGKKIKLYCDITRTDSGRNLMTIGVGCARKGIDPEKISIYDFKDIQESLSRKRQYGFSILATIFDEIVLSHYQDSKTGEHWGETRCSLQL